MTFIALTGDSQPHFTTIADFISTLGEDTLITADAGYHSKDNLLALDSMNIDALIADNQMRQRDARFDSQARPQAKPAPLHNKTPQRQSTPRFQPSDFT